MNDITIKESLKWTDIKSLVRSYTESVQLHIGIHNNTTHNVCIRMLCLSLKRWFRYKDILQSHKNDIILPNGEKGYDINIHDIKNFIENNKKFRVKVVTYNKTFMSKPLSIESLLQNIRETSF